MAKVFINNAAVGSDSGVDEANAFPTFAGATAASADGSEYLPANTHVEPTSADVTLAFSTDKALHDTVKSIIFGGGEVYSKGAQVNPANGFKLIVTGHVRSSGVNLDVGAGGSSALNQMRLCAADGDEQEFVDFDIRLDGTDVLTALEIGAEGTKLTLTNFGYFQNGVNPFIHAKGIVNIKGLTVLSGSGSPAGFIRGLGGHANVNIDGADFVEFGTGWDVYKKSVGSVSLLIKSSRTAASWVGEEVVSDLLFAADEIVLQNFGSVDINHGYVKRVDGGRIDDEIVLYAGGASGLKRNTVLAPFSLKMTSNANCSLSGRQLYTPLIPDHNEVTGSQTRQIEFIHLEASLLTDAQVFGEWRYLATAGQQIATLITDSFDTPYGTHDPQATPADQETSLKDWTEGMTERADSTVYVAGDRVKQNQTAMAVFECTVGGTTNATVPPAFLNSSDGDSIIDNTVTWVQMWRQKVSVVVNPAEQGLLVGRLIVADPSLTLYVDPRLT